MNIRCYFHKTLDKLNEKFRYRRLPEDYKKSLFQAFSTTLFEKLLQTIFSGQANSKHLTKNVRWFKYILNFYDLKEKKFNILGFEFKLEEEYARSMLGLSDGTEDLAKWIKASKSDADNSSTSSTDDKPWYFDLLGPKCNSGTVLDKIGDIIGDENQIDYLVKLVCCYLMVTTIDPKSNSVILPKQCEVFSDMEKLKTYNWSKYIVQHLEKTLDKILNKRKASMTGFSYLLTPLVCVRRPILLIRSFKMQIPCS